MDDFIMKILGIMEYELREAFEAFCWILYSQINYTEIT